MNVQLRANFSGHVQGVGFRFQTESVARNFDVQGYVQNLADGTVALVAEGEKAELERFLAEIQAKMAANIRETRQSWARASDQYADFSIKR